MNTGNKTGPVHIDAFICTLINFVDKDVMLVVFVVVFSFFHGLKKRGGSVSKWLERWTCNSF